MKNYLLAAILLSFIYSGCSAYRTAVNVTRLKYKLDTINNYTVCGVAMEGKKSIKDFTAFELLRITGDVTKKTFPASFIVNVIAMNDSTGGYPRTDIIIKSFPWKLIIDERETVSGDINSPVAVPGTGEMIPIPIRVAAAIVRPLRTHAAILPEVPHAARAAVLCANECPVATLGARVPELARTAIATNAARNAAALARIEEGIGSA